MNSSQLSAGIAIQTPGLSAECGFGKSNHSLSPGSCGCLGYSLRSGGSSSAQHYACGLSGHTGTPSRMKWPGFCLFVLFVVV